MNDHRPCAPRAWVPCLLGLLALGASLLTPWPASGAAQQQETQAPQADSPEAVQRLVESEPREDVLVRLLPLLYSSNPKVASTAARLVSCENFNERREQFVRAAKDPRAAKAARRALEHPSKEVQCVAAAVSALAGDRGEKTRRILRQHFAWGLERHEMLALFTPDSARDSLVIGLVQHADPQEGEEGEGHGVIEPILLYQRGQWEHAHPSFMTGTRKWFAVRRDPNTGALTRAAPLETGLEAKEYTAGCGNPGLGFPMPGPPPKEALFLALSKDVPLSTFEPPSPELRTALLKLEEGQSENVLRQARKPEESQPCPSEVVNTLKYDPGFKGLFYEPELLRCTQAPPPLGRLCYVRRYRAYSTPKKAQQEACTNICFSETWMADNGEGPRLLSSHHECGQGEKSGSGTPPLAALTQDDRVFVLGANTCYEGCDGFTVLEATPTGVRELAAGGSAAVCD